MSSFLSIFPYCTVVLLGVASSLIMAVQGPGSQTKDLHRTCLCLLARSLSWETSDRIYPYRIFMEDTTKVPPFHLDRPLLFTIFPAIAAWYGPWLRPAALLIRRTTGEPGDGESPSRHETLWYSITACTTELSVYSLRAYTETRDGGLSAG